MANTATARINPKKQTLEDAYSPPANFLEIDIVDPQTHGVAKARYTDYEVRMKVGRRKSNFRLCNHPFSDGSASFSCVVCIVFAIIQYFTMSASCFFTLIGSVVPGTVKDAVIYTVRSQEPTFIERLFSLVVGG